MITLQASTLAIMPGRTARFFTSGGTPPYVYSVVPGGAGGTVDPVTGVYQAPATLSSDPALMSDTILVTDAVAAVASMDVVVGSALMMLCDVIASELSLAPDQVFLWNQKWTLPNDSRLYVSVQVLSMRPFSNSNRLNSDGTTTQYANFHVITSIDIMSRGTSARDRKEEIVLALNSDYAQSQQEINAFYLGKQSSNFVDLSEQDGAAIPYRFNISVALMYFIEKTKPVPYYDQFPGPTFNDILVSEDGDPLTTEDGDRLIAGITIEP